MTPPKLEAGFVRMPEEEFEAMLARAAEQGARRALADVGLDGPEAAIDIHDLRTLLDSLRMVSGLLFLRRAEKGIGNRIREDFVTALGFFRAACVMERSVSGREYPVTTFRIARTIYSASDCFRTVNPIPDLSTGDRSDQLALAESYFSSVASRTTGKFRDLAREMQSKAAKLGSALREDKN